MKFQIPFHRNFEYFDKDKTEIFIKYKPNIKKLDDFIGQYLDYRIVIAFEEPGNLKDWEIIQVLLQKYPNADITVRVPEYLQYVEDNLNKYNIPHYYQEIINNEEDLLGFCALNITDIRIGGKLAFMLYFTSKIARENNVRLRCFCNLSDQKWQSIPPIKSFFIRPEDIPFYSQFIDTFEFFPYSENPNYNTLYEIYGINHKWYGKLNEIIYNYRGEQDNRTLIPEFGQYRTRCHRNCLMNETACQFCQRITELGYALDEKNIIVKYNQ